MGYIHTQRHTMSQSTITHNTIYSVIKQYHSTLHLPAKAPTYFEVANQPVLLQKMVENVARLLKLRMDMKMAIIFTI